MPKSDTFAHIVDLAARRNAQRATSRALLQGRITQAGTATEGWDPVTRERVLRHIAAVMRAGLRRDDHVVMRTSGDFSVALSGTDERSAVNIAHRLRGRLGKLSLARSGTEVPLTASIGVAAELSSHSNHDQLEKRGSRALTAALAKGGDLVVTASEIEEVILLPAPAPSAAQSASAA